MHAFTIALLGTLQAPALPMEERTRNFPAYQCSFTLPGEDWSWVDRPVPNTLFVAANRRGIVATLSVAPLSRSVPLDQNFVEGFEKTYYVAGKLQKRGGRFSTWQGWRCYQAEGLFPDGRTTATTIIVAPRLSYQLGVIGGTTPVETDPEFEKVLAGFHFTQSPSSKIVSPSPPEPTVDETANFSRMMGQVAGLCLFVALVIGVVTWATRKQKPPRRRDWDDDD